MDQEILRKIISGGENQTVEFKTSLNQRDEGLADLCAMVNADAGEGIVFFGLAPSGCIQSFHFHCPILAGDPPSANFLEGETNLIFPLIEGKLFSNQSP